MNPQEAIQTILSGYFSNLLPMGIGCVMGFVGSEIYRRKHLQLLRESWLLAGKLEPCDEPSCERPGGRNDIVWIARLKLRHTRLQLRVLHLKFSNARLQSRIGRHERSIPSAEPAKRAAEMPGDDSPNDCGKSGN